MLAPIESNIITTVFSLKVSETAYTVNITKQNGQNGQCKEKMLSTRGELCVEG